jgi:hypothetical protein
LKILATAIPSKKIFIYHEVKKINEQKDAYEKGTINIETYIKYLKQKAYKYNLILMQYILNSINF